MADLNSITSNFGDLQRKPISAEHWDVLTKLSPSVLRSAPAAANELQYTALIDIQRFQADGQRVVNGYRRTSYADMIIANVLHRVLVEQEIIGKAIRELANELDDEQAKSAITSIADSLHTEEIFAG